MPGRVTFWTSALVVLVLAGCGGDSDRQDDDEPSGSWTVDTQARFPERQRLAEQVALRIRVRNRDDSAVPNVAVTVDGLSRRSEQPGLADPNRPVWVVDDAPRGGVTAYTNTWALGRIPPGQAKEFVWRVTPVQAGRYRVNYRVSAGLDGKAKARLAGGGQPEGRFDVLVSRAPSQARVNPDTGAVERR